MVDKWRSSTWGEEISLEYGKALRGYDETCGQYRVFGSNGPIGWTSQPLSDGPGVILGRKGAYRGVHFSPDPFFVIDTAYYVVPRNDFDMRWLYYAIKHYKLGEVDDGSPIPSTTRSAVYMLDFEIPPFPEQRAIAHILGTLDDKIELNRRMNETLEAMARVLFKSWFVDFDPVRAKAEGRDSGLPKHIADIFPDSFEESEMEAIPKGWAVKRIESVAERVGMGPFGSSIKVETFVTEGIPVISGQHLHNFMMEDKTFNFIAAKHAEKLKSANVQRGDIIFTHAGNIGQVAYIPDNSKYARYVISQRQFFMRCDRRQVTPSFIALYFKSPKGQHQLLANASSSGVPSIAQPVTYLRTIPLVIPPKPVMDMFEKHIQPVLVKLRRNIDESHKLAVLRDMLLPKLNSGELRVKDAEKFIGRVI